jgi:hypothetical protein
MHGFVLQLGKEIIVCEFIIDQLMIMFMEDFLVDVEFVHCVDRATHELFSLLNDTTSSSHLIVSYLITILCTISFESKF